MASLKTSSGGGSITVARRQLMTVLTPTVKLPESFLVISRHVSEVLGYFKTVANGDPAADFYLPRIMDLEIIFTTTHTLMSRFHSLAMLSLTGYLKKTFLSLVVFVSPAWQRLHLWRTRRSNPWWISSINLKSTVVLADCGCRGGL